MSASDSPRWDRGIEPECLGPLADRPLAATSASPGEDTLFPGASTYLSRRQQQRRRQQWEAAGPLAGLVLQPEERIAYVAHAMQVPPVLHAIALGAMALPYHQVVLVFTDRRIIEVLLRWRGKKAGTRVRSFPWAGVRDAGIRLNKLQVVSA